MTTEAYPLTINKNNFNLLRIIGGGTFLMGIVALSTPIALVGWTKSKTIGIITTIVGILTLLVVVLVA